MTLIKCNRIKATTGEKSNIPVLGSIFLIGPIMGSVMPYIKRRTGTNGLPGDTLNQETKTRAKIAK